MNHRPKVSVCATFLNSEKFIVRFIESCLAQTYDNLEVVLLDDASTDGADNIAAHYAARDPRVKYMKTAERLGIIKSLEMAYSAASGDFIIWLGLDDWLAKDALENAVKAALAHPEASAIMPRVISLRELGGDKFEFINDVAVPPGVRSREWMARRIYRDLQAANCLFAMFRREDALRAVRYFLNNCCYSPLFPEELRKIALQKAYAPDFVFFLEILTRYKNCVSEDSFRVIKIAHTFNLAFDVIKSGTAAETLKTEYYRLIFFDPIYKSGYPAFYRGMRIYTRAHSLSEIYINFLRSGLKLSFFNIEKDKKIAANLFAGFSALDIAAAALLSIPKFIYRFFAFLFRKFAGKLTSQKDEMAPFYDARYFLDRESGFSAN